ncbi:hypothetical protein [Moorena sp. SIO2C4]|uniref:hypothetical protein n=1 Tax=Moorena sp. SIO2C4 TaxID=2607824 RepID=UPI0013C26CB7|nr:hypothetical protein [Moorena sp. SIO2C4]NEP32893.1 hypothetical protein [Moorena sp. SIO3B2]NEQ18337.1 hypothetical protein [Moorena sp. SIO3E2]NES45685.1 hypothetical protein [Moorena sp. SIO2C4]
MTYSHTLIEDYSVGFLPTPAIANGYTGYFINDTVRSYPSEQSLAGAAFMVSRLWVKG